MGSHGRRRLDLGGLDEIAENTQGHRLALFGMELNGRDILAGDAGGEPLTVSAVRRDDGRVAWDGKIRVHEVNVRMRREILPKSMSARSGFQLVPADLRHLEAGRGKAFHGPLEKAKSPDTRRFLTAFE